MMMAMMKVTKAQMQIQSIQSHHHTAAVSSVTATNDGSNYTKLTSWS